MMKSRQQRRRLSNVRQKKVARGERFSPLHLHRVILRNNNPTNCSNQISSEISTTERSNSSRTSTSSSCDSFTPVRCTEMSSNNTHA
mmetsp:Transcript_15546/g.17723  ORF Transcript_15546/g.17723 Transcript_15546/m.17723 type:complete len:87 (-) Transcript_15546:224-484(-)